MKLELNNVSIGFSGQKPLQRSINFTVGSGEICCILGPNGCGKSTLVRTILGIEPLLEGSILYNGAPMANFSAKKMAAAVAYVAQNHSQSFPYLVKDVVMLGRLGAGSLMGNAISRKDQNIVENALEAMGIRHLRDIPYTQISGGELELVMFARALAQEAPLLILDEPTAALDYGNAVRIIQKIRDIADSNRAVIMVTHNPDHAFMVSANVALFKKQKPMVYGEAQNVITRQNIQDAYGVNVKLVEFIHDNDEVVRTCAPEFTKRRKASA